MNTQSTAVARLCILAGVLAGSAWPQSSLSQTTAPSQATGKTAGQPAAAAPYANMPQQAVPYRRFRKP